MDESRIKQLLQQADRTPEFPLGAAQVAQAAIGLATRRRNRAIGLGIFTAAAAIPIGLAILLSWQAGEPPRAVAPLPVALTTPRAIPLPAARAEELHIPVGIDLSGLGLSRTNLSPPALEDPLPRLAVAVIPAVSSKDIPVLSLGKN